MNIPGRRPKTVDQFGESHNIGRSTVYEEKKRGRLKFTKVGRKSLIYPEDEDAWRELCRADEPNASDEKRLLEEVVVAEGVRDVIDIAKSFAKAIAKLPARKRDDLVERFSDLCAERTPNK